MERVDKAVGLIVSAAIAAVGILYGLGAAYHKDNPAESHTLYHWGAGVAAGAAALLVVVFLFWPAYVWAVDYRTRYMARLPGRPTLHIPFTGRLRRRKSSGSLVIVKAVYGRDDPCAWTDVTETIRRMVKDGRLAMTVTTAGLGITDPLPGVVKELRVTYKVGGDAEKVSDFTEGFQVELP
jgi:hypothetical protein